MRLPDARIIITALTNRLIVSINETIIIPLTQRQLLPVAAMLEWRGGVAYFELDACDVEGGSRGANNTDRASWLD